MTVVCLGDLLLDVIVRLLQPVARGADTPSEITLSTGGQAANVAAWVAELGGSARWVGKRARDLPGRAATSRVEELGVELVGPVVSHGGGILTSLVDVDGARTMFPDRGVAASLRADDLDPRWFACDHLHVSGYALLEAPVRDAAVRAVELARAEGAGVSVDLSSWSAIRDVGAARFRSFVESLAVDVVFANEDEDAIVGGPIDETHWILKRGATGCRFGEDERSALPVAEVVDTTGAGDALAAGWIVGGPDLALRAAARCVERPGSMP